MVGFQIDWNCGHYRRQNATTRRARTTRAPCACACVRVRVRDGKLGSETRE